MTITEIAKLAGVSIGTVDRVIHSRGRVSPQTKEKIETVIAEYEYKPNPLAQHLKNNKDLVIGVLLPQLESENTYWKSLYNGILKAKTELEAFSIKIIHYEFDRTLKGSFTKASNKLMKYHIDALIIAPVVPAETYDFLNRVGSIPYVFVDSPLPHAKPLATVAQNPFKAGYCAARITNILNPQGKIFVCIQMHESAHNLTERIKGFHSYFARIGKAEVCTKILTDTDNDKNYHSFIDSIFNEYTNIDGFFIANDSVHKLHEYFISKKRDKNCSIVGFDLLNNNTQYLLNGSVDMLISQQEEVQGYKAVTTIYQSLILKQHIEKDIDLNIEIYFKENLPEFIMG